MLQVPPLGLRPPISRLADRSPSIRINSLIAQYELGARRRGANYYVLQGLTIGLAAITPCLIVLAKENRATSTELAAVVLSGCRRNFGLPRPHLNARRRRPLPSLVEGVRSQLWRFQTRAGRSAGAPRTAPLTTVVNVDALITRGSALERGAARLRTRR